MISHVYRGHVIVRKAENKHEVEALCRVYPTEEAARQAVDQSLKSWVEGYDLAPREPVDTAR